MTPGGRQHRRIHLPGDPHCAQSQPVRDEWLPRGRMHRGRGHLAEAGVRMRLACPPG